MVGGEILESLGGWAVGQARYGADLFGHLVRALVAFRRREGTALVQRTTLQQIYFTGVDAVWVVSALALVLGAIVIVQTLSFMSGTGGEYVLGTVMELIVVRELGPVMTALIVIGRSGSSITVELGNMRVGGEIDLLESMGIDPIRYLVIPRMLGVTSAIFCLCLIFDLVAVLGGYAVARFAIDVPLVAFVRVVGQSVTFTDLAMSGLKTVLFGVVIATVSTWQGLAVQGGVTGVPQATRRSVVHAILLCVVLNGVISAAVFLQGL